MVAWLAVHYNNWNFSLLLLLVFTAVVWLFLLTFKLYTSSTINTWKKLVRKYIWADKKWACFWQITACTSIKTWNLKQYSGLDFNLEFQIRMRMYFTQKLENWKNNHDLSFSCSHNSLWSCQNIKSVFRILGVYDFADVSAFELMDSSGDFYGHKRCGS